MPVQPISPRIGNERQRRQRQSLEEMLQQSAQRRSMLSRFARSGAPRGGARSAVRGVGVRAFSGGVPNRLAGGPGTFSPRMPGANPNARIPWDELPGGGNGPPRVGPPSELPTPLDRPHQLPNLWKQPNPQPIYNQIPGLFNQAAPSDPMNIGGLIPLGGGLWLDPASGMIHGQGGLQSLT